MRAGRSIRAGSPRARRSAAGWRVEAEVAGALLWFESPDAVLDAAPEAVASAVLPVAAAHQARLIPADPPDATFLANARRLLEITGAWWGEPRDPETVLAEVPAGADDANGRSWPAARGAGLCWSGGVDSFHALLRGDGRVDAMVFVHGYDIPLADGTRLRGAEESLRRVAADLGLAAVLIRTNLREHPLWRLKRWAWRRWRWRRLRVARWERVHGGALAAAGHLLRPALRELRIAASYPLAFDRPFGSHWRIDPLWSSRALRVAHVGAEKWRTGKLLELVDEPLVRRHLRICWRNLSPAGNCGRCEKCIRTMLILEGAGRLDRFPVFPSPGGLAREIDRLPSLGADLMPVYRAFLETGLSRPVRDATVRLLQRAAGRRPARPAGAFREMPQRGDV